MSRGLGTARIRRRGTLNRVSRGLGKLERAVLDLVPEAPKTTHTAQIALTLFGEQATEAQRRSMRRAVTSLARKGLLEKHLDTRPAWVRDVVASARPGGSGYWKRDRGWKLGESQQNVLSRPRHDGDPAGRS